MPAAGENRINGMVLSKPDWVISRQRAWGVPITVFVREQDDGSAEILNDERVNKRIADAFEQEGADAWYATGAARRFLEPEYNANEWQKVDDILDVWFDSGSTHAFVLEDPEHFPGLAGIRRKRDGGADTVMYLEGSDQHRGWFQSSLLESCGTRGYAPFDVVLTHGFTLDAHGRKMSKSLKNGVEPQDIIKQSGADILRLWVCQTDYWDDQRIGPEILKNTIEAYRKLRNTLRWMLGSLAHFHDDDRVAPARMPELERLMLHRLAELDALVRRDYADFDYKRIVAALNTFMTVDLSAFYFDIRKDALYCDPISSLTRRACLTVIDHLFRCTVTWLAPMLPFTAEEAWLTRYPSEDGSVHLEQFPPVPAEWRNDALAEQWRKVRTVRSVVTGALEIERARKAHRLVAGSRADRLCLRHGAFRRDGGRRPRRNRDHFGRPIGRGRGSAGRLPPPRRQGRRGRGAARRRPQMRAVVEDTADGRRGSALSRRIAARRPGTAGVGRHAQGRRMTKMLWGPLTRLGLAVAVVTAALDQASKLWLLFGFGLGERGVVTLTPFLDLVLAWNTGISFSLFPQDGFVGQWVLLLLTLIALLLLWLWLARAASKLTAVALGLIIGGAIGNAIDRFAYGAVVDFVRFHITTQTFDFNWAVFNLADAAIVFGVIFLLYETLWGGAAKAP